MIFSDVTLTINGVSSSYPVRGSYQLVGSLPATVAPHKSVVADDWGVWVKLDWDVLGPKLADRGIDRFANGEVLDAHLSVHRDGVMDWPVNPGGAFGSFAADQLGTGLTSTVADKELYDQLPAGLWQFGSYRGRIYLAFQRV